MNCDIQTNLCAKRGDTFARLFTFTKAGTPLDMTGATLTFTMKRNSDDTDAQAVLQKPLDITNALGGLAQLELTASQMELELGNYWYDVQLENNLGVNTVVIGRFSVSQDITRGIYG